VLISFFEAKSIHLDATNPRNTNKRPLIIFPTEKYRRPKWTKLAVQLSINLIEAPFPSLDASNGADS
jgi:hypothetical protein